MCMRIDESVKSSKKRFVWKVFVALFKSFKYPKGKLIERSRNVDAPYYRSSDGALIGNVGLHFSSSQAIAVAEVGLHFYSSKAIAVAEAKNWPDSYIAKFAVDPADFVFAGGDGNDLMYERATRVGNYIKVRGKPACGS